MSLRGFIDVAFAIFVAEYQRLGVSMMEAIDKVMVIGEPGPPEEEKVAVQNATAMETMMGMLAGVKGAPGAAA